MTSGGESAPLSPRSQEFLKKAERCFELQLSEQKLEAQKKLVRMQKREESPTGLYRAIRAIFSAQVEIFYHYTELVGVENLPPEGNAAILCPNHGNSLTDAVVCVSQTPRLVRLTAKDTLFKLPFFGWFVRNLGTVPLQRADEHVDGVDNKAAVTELNQTLLDGAMVCLFPEGRSRFHWGVSEVRRGVASIAYACLAEAKRTGQTNYTLSLVPSAFNYLHREKFRSGLVVEYAPPVVLTPGSEFMSLDKRDAINEISNQLQELMSLTAFNAEDWNTMRIAHTARNIFAPLGTRVTLAEHVRLTKYWCNALSVNDVTDLSLREDLTNYQDELDTIGLKHQRVIRPIESQLWLIWCMFLRILQLIIIVPVSVLGLILWSPIFYVCKRQEASVMKRTKKPTHVDEVAQYKLLTGFIGLPLTVVCISCVVVWMFSLAWLAILWVLPTTTLFMWLSVRFIEDTIASLRSLRSLYTLFCIPNESHSSLNLTVKALFTRLEARAKLCGNITPPEPPVKRGWWFEVISKFDPRRRRKKDWNECLRYDSLF